MQVSGLNVKPNGTQYQFQTSTGCQLRVDVSTQLANNAGIMIQAPQEAAELFYVALDDSQYRMTGVEVSNREGFLAYIIQPGPGDRFIVKAEGEYALFRYETTGFRFMGTETNIGAIGNGY